MAKRIQVILTQDVSKLGRLGDLVEVAPGYARNYLIPQGIGAQVNRGVLRQYEVRRAREQERLAALKIAAEAQKAALEKVGKISIAKQVGENDAIFGTVTNADVAEAILAATKQEVDRRDVTVPDINQIGTYSVQIKLHPDVSATLELNVVAQ